VTHQAINAPGSENTAEFGPFGALGSTQGYAIS
jgi:hypothetical protein